MSVRACDYKQTSVNKKTDDLQIGQVFIEGSSLGHASRINIGKS